jgi:HEAT repeat protein
LVWGSSLPLPAPPPDADAATVRLLAHLAGEHADSLCREAAVAALGAVGHPDALAAVLRATDDRATVRRRAVLALAAFDGTEVTAALQRLTGDRDLQVRQAAEELLAIERGERVLGAD